MLQYILLCKIIYLLCKIPQLVNRPTNILLKNSIRLTNIYHRVCLLNPQIRRDFHNHLENY